MTKVRSPKAGIDLADAHVVLTGATGGVGSALARELSGRGARLSLVARREGPLNQLATELGGVAIRADLSDLAQVDDLGARLNDVNGPVDILVNNAAVVVAGPHADQSAEDVRQTLIANLLAPVELTRQVLPSMIKNGRGTVVNVSSLVAETPLPNTASYSTSKAGLTQFTLNLQLEIRKTPVTALLVVLGSILGTTLNDAGLRDPVVARLTTKFEKLPHLSADFVASRIAQALAEGRQSLILPAVSAPAVHFRRLPGRLAEVLMGGM